MTHTDTAPTDDSGATDGSAASTKAVLFCPRCGYRAPLDGAWHVGTASGDREVRCPDCGVRVA